MQHRHLDDLAQPRQPPRSLGARLIGWATYVPEAIPREERRAFLVSSGSAVSAGTLHLAMLVVFFVFGVWPLAYFNIASVLWFIGVFVLVRRTGDSGLAMIAFCIEVVVHQVLAVYYLGWDYGSTSTSARSSGWSRSFAKRRSCSSRARRWRRGHERSAGHPFGA